MAPVDRVEPPWSTSGAGGKLQPDSTGSATDRRAAVEGLHIDPVGGRHSAPSRPDPRS